MRKFKYKIKADSPWERIEADDYTHDDDRTLTFWKGKKRVGQKIKTLSIYRGWEVHEQPYWEKC